MEYSEVLLHTALLPPVTLHSLEWSELLETTLGRNMSSDSAIGALTFKDCKRTKPGPPFFGRENTTKISTEEILSIFN